MKRLILFLAMTFCLFSAMAAYDFTTSISAGGGTTSILYLKYITNTPTSRTVAVTCAGNEATPYRNTDTKPRGQITIPSSIRNTSNNYSYTVVKIDASAFYGCNELTSVSVPNTVTEIGSSAFVNCSSLTSVTLPNAITAINATTFSGCSSLQSITIPSSVATIGNWAFRYCSSLQNVYFNATNCTSIGSDIFQGCSNVTSLVFGNGVQYIPNAKFRYFSLTSVTIPESVTRIANNAFINCTTLTNVNYNARRCTSMGSPDYLVFAGCNNLRSLTIGDNVEIIPAYAFMGCGLWNVNIPESVTSIGTAAFYGCRYLQAAISVPNAVVNIGEYAFDGTAISFFHVPNNNATIGQNAFPGGAAVYYCGEQRGAQYGDVLIGCFPEEDGLMYVDDEKHYLLKYTGSSESVVIPNTVSVIRINAFLNCSSLKSVVVPSSLTDIDRFSFGNCFNLEVVYNLSNTPIEIIPDDNPKAKVVNCTTTGIGSNAIHKIPSNYSVVDDNDEPTTTRTDYYIHYSIVPDNFIYSNDNGATWLAKNIVLTDGQDEFNTDVPFTAENATYTRTFTDGNRSTLCLPFTVAMPESLEAYAFTGYDNGTLHFTSLEQDANIVAYTPYLVGKNISESKASFTFFKEHAEFPATNLTAVAHDGMTFQGVMARTTMTNTNTYGYKDGYFVQSGGSAHVNPFRCYFTTGDPIYQTLSVDTDGDYLGIEDVDGDVEQSSIRYSNDVYDMMGRLVRKNAESLRGLPKGIYIWRGKKQIAF